MRIQTRLSTLSCLLSFLFLFTASGAMAYQVEESTNLRGQEDRYCQGCGGATADAMKPENQEKTEPENPQVFDHHTGGQYTQGGTSSGNFISQFDQAPKMQQQRRQAPGPQQKQFKEWTATKKPDKKSHPGPPEAGDEVYHHTPPYQEELNYPDPFTAAYRENFDKETNMPGGVAAAEDITRGMGLAASMMGDAANDPQQAFKGGQACGQGACQGASEAMADAFDPTWLCMMDLQNETLLNVANEATGSPASSMQPTKTHQNAVYFVQRMYKEVYLPMAILLLLPGAVITHTKGFVAHGVMMNQNDDDGVSPFTGILRSIIAIFLIPATQLILSWCIDVGNSMHQEVNPYVNVGVIYMWADEQVFRAPIAKAMNKIMDPAMFPILGKMSQGPEDQSGYEAQSAATIMLQTMANTMAQSAAFGLVMLCAFQITMVCYLMLMGPIAAAFYAWPGSVGSLFSRIFPVWVDAVINLALWKFWWTVVLLCMSTRLSWLGAAGGGWTMYGEWELLMFIAFLIILTYVPFNPFDFKAGDMVSQVMQKAEQAVGEASKKGGG